jgi:hypothetical protein
VDMAMVVARRRVHCDDSKDDVCVVDKQIMRASLLVHNGCVAPLAVVPPQPRYCTNSAVLQLFLTTHRSSISADRLYHNPWSRQIDNIEHELRLRLECSTEESVAGRSNLVGISQENDSEKGKEEHKTFS